MFFARMLWGYQTKYDTDWGYGRVKAPARFWVATTEGCEVGDESRGADSHPFLPV